MTIELSEEEMIFVHKILRMLQTDSLHTWQEMATQGVNKTDLTEQWLITGILHHISYLFGRTLGIEHDEAAESLIAEGYDTFMALKQFLAEKHRKKEDD